MDEVLVQPVVEMRDVWTNDDVRRLDVPDWWRYEIVDGSLVVSPSAGGDHELVSAGVRAAVWSSLPPGTAIVGPMGVDIGASYLIPDLLVASASAIRGRALVAAGDVALAIEIVSPGSVSMDRLVKPAKYAAAGIAHFWRVETEPVSLTAYRLSGDAYVEVGTWSGDETVRLREPFAVELELGLLLPSVP